MTISVGTRFPAYATSMGRVLLAAQPEPWLDAYLSTASLHHLTGHTITTASGLRQELRKIRTARLGAHRPGTRGGAPLAGGPDQGLGRHRGRGGQRRHPRGRRSLDSIVADLLSPLLATAERIERDLASARTTAPAAPPARPAPPGDLTARRHGHRDRPLAT